MYICRKSKWSPKWLPLRGVDFLDRTQNLNFLGISRKLPRVDAECGPDPLNPPGLCSSHPCNGTGPFGNQVQRSCLPRRGARQTTRDDPWRAEATLHCTLIASPHPKTCSFRSQVPQGPPDVILGFAQAFRESEAPGKINLVVGAYRDAEGKPWVLPSVRAAEYRLIEQGANKEYAAAPTAPALVCASVLLDVMPCRPPPSWAACAAAVEGGVTCRPLLLLCFDTTAIAAAAACRHP